jgi:predicted Rossmann fold nucleotide-binding protein DprA/Smf involved in DNA uptake
MVAVSGGLKPISVSFKSLLEYFDNDLEAAWRASTTELAQAGLTRNTIENVLKLRKTSTPQKELEKLEKLRIRVITWRDKTYPHLFLFVSKGPAIDSTEMEARFSSGDPSLFRFFNEAEEYTCSSDDSAPVSYIYGKLTKGDQLALAVVGTSNSSTCQEPAP